MPVTLCYQFQLGPESMNDPVGSFFHSHCESHNTVNGGNCRAHQNSQDLSIFGCINKKLPSLQESRLSEEERDTQQNTKSMKLCQMWLFFN